MRRMVFDFILFGDLLAGLLGLPVHDDFSEAISRYISLCAYIGKDPPMQFP
jgi:hypothetical protein